MAVISNTTTTTRPSMPLTPSRSRRSIKHFFAVKGSSRRLADQQKDEHIKQEVIASDVAYNDMILDQGDSLLKNGLGWNKLVNVETESLRIRRRQEISYIVTHTVTYKNQPIWRLETKSKYNSQGSSGKSSLCSVMQSKGVVRVKIIEKNKTCLGKGSNHTTFLNPDIFAMILASSEARQQEMTPRR